MSAVAAQWYVQFAPAGTPAPLVHTMNQALKDLLTEPRNARRIEEHGAEIHIGSPEHLQALVGTEFLKWKGVVDEAILDGD